MATPNSPSAFQNIFATNPSSKFKEWSLKLSNGATLTGITYDPSSSSPISGSPKALLVGIHGATCTAYNYDADPSLTASVYCDLFSLPFVAFHRPNFLGSSGWLVDRSSSEPSIPQFTAAENGAYYEEEGRWYHEYIFPALWKEFAMPYGCTSLVTTSHSMSVPMTIIAASLYSTRPETSGYIWAGMVLSGFGEIQTKHSQTVSGGLMTNEYSPDQLPHGQDPSIHIPPLYQADKEDLMLGPPSLCSDELRPLVWKQNAPFLLQEILDMVGFWPAAKARYKAGVEIAVLYALGEYDWVWKASKANVDMFCNEFTASPRVEGAMIESAPHAIEWSPVARGWWTRVFGWAIEVEQSRAMGRSKPKNYE